LLHIYFVARTTGNLDKLGHGYDWKGEICGIDEAVKDKPFLYWCNNGNYGLVAEALQYADLHTVDREQALRMFGVPALLPLDGVCVKACVTNHPMLHWCPGPAQTFEETKIADYIEGSYTKEADVMQIDVGVRRNLTLAKAYASQEALGYCFPTFDTALMRNVFERTHVTSFTKQVVFASDGAIKSGRFLIGVAFSCIVFGYLLLFALQYSFKQTIYALAILANFVLIITGIYFVVASLSSEQNFMGHFFQQPVFRLWARFWALGVAATTFLLCFRVNSLRSPSRDTTSMAVDGAKAAFQIIEHRPSMLLQPLFHSFLVVILVFALVNGFALLVSNGKAVPMSPPFQSSGLQIAGIQRNFELSSFQWACLFSWILGFVWIFEALRSVGQFAISFAVVSFSFQGKTESYPILKGYAVGLSYHLGTVCFGGIVAGYLQLITIIFRCFLRHADSNSARKASTSQVLSACCDYCSSCIDYLESMVNDLVFTDIALQSSSYLQAARNVSELAVGRQLMYDSIKTSTIMVRTLGMTVLGVGGTSLSYYALVTTDFHLSLERIFYSSSSMLSTSHILGTTIASGFICFQIAHAFLLLFSQISSSLLYCRLIGALPSPAVASFPPEQGFAEVPQRLKASTEMFERSEEPDLEEKSQYFSIFTPRPQSQIPQVARPHVQRLNLAAIQKEEGQE
jgi:hypothetical protein